MQESLAAILELTFEFWPYCGLVASRLGAKPIQPLCFMECRDGWIFLCCVEEHQWRQFVEIMGSPEWAEMELFENRLARGANFDALQALPPGLVPRAVGAGALRGGAAPPRALRARLDDGRSARLPPPACARLLRHPRPPGRRRRHHARRALPLLGRRRGRCGARRRASDSTPPRCSPRSASTPRALARRGSRAMSRRAPLDGHPGRRLHLGVGRSVLHAPARAPRRRGDPRRERDPALRHAPAPAVRRASSRARTAAATSTSTTRARRASRST